MITLLLQTLLFGLLFVAIVWLTFYIVGFGILAFHKKNLSELEDGEIIALAPPLGVIIFVIFAVLFGLLNLRLLVLPLLLLIILYTIARNKMEIIKPWKIFKKEKVLLALIILGVLVQGFINFPSGMLYKDGLLFWSSQGHDGIWHIALMEEIRKNFPPQNPIFAGERLYNYHYLVDVLMGEFYRIFPFFSPLDLYFRFFPLIFSFLIGTSVFTFVKRWQNNAKIAYLALFFTYFTGSFGYIFTYIKQGHIFGGETVFWAAQLNTILGNPPHAISISFLTCFLLSFYLLISKGNKFWFFICILLASVLAGFKVSAGLVLLLGLGVAACVDLIFNRRFTTLILFVLLGISNFITIKSMTKGLGSFLIFLPWWFVRTMVVARLDWIDLELRRQHYLSVGRWTSYLRVLQLESLAFSIFLVGNLGMRFLGFYEQIRKIWVSKINFFKSPLEVLLFTITWISFLIPMLFVQRGIIYNNIQFMQYFLLIFGFYAAISAFRIIGYFKNRMLKLAALFLIVSLSIPTVIGNLVEFYGRPPLAKVTNLELQALNFLKNNSKADEIVLNAPFNKYLHDKFDKQPWPLYVWYSTAYIPALTGLKTYLSSEEQALITGYPIDERLEKMGTFFKQEDIDLNKRFLQDNKIDYLYLVKKAIETPLKLGNNLLEVFFENDEIIIYRVKEV